VGEIGELVGVGADESLIVGVAWMFISFADDINFNEPETSNLGR